MKPKGEFPYNYYIQPFRQKNTFLSFREGKYALGHRRVKPDTYDASAQMWREFRLPQHHVALLSEAGLQELHSESGVNTSLFRTLGFYKNGIKGNLLSSDQDKEGKIFSLVGDTHVVVKEFHNSVGGTLP